MNNQNTDKKYFILKLKGKGNIKRNFSERYSEFD